MALKLSKFEKISYTSMAFLIFGVFCSFVDLGVLSVFFSVVLPLLFIINCFICIYALIKKKYHYLLGVIIFLVFNSFFFRISIGQKTKRYGSVSLISYNVREFKYPASNEPSLSADDEILKFIDSTDSDILAFQEASYIENQRIADYPFVFLGYREGVKKSLLSIYSKFPIVKTGYIDFPDTRNNAIYADITVRNETVRVYNIHLQSFVVNKYVVASNYDNFSYWKNLNTTLSKQLEQSQMVLDHAQKSNKKFIICGDFNATPYSKTYRKFGRDLSDSYLEKGQGFGKTFSIFKVPLRLDYFFHNDGIEVFRHDNFNIKLSDHEPIAVEFKIK